VNWASFTIDGRAGFGIVRDDQVVDISAVAPSQATDLRDVIALGLLEELAQKRAHAPVVAAARVTWLPVIPNPEKILCIGLNYETHRVEAGRAQVAHPTVFLRLPSSQVGHGANLIRPRVSQQLDFEGELAVIIGRSGRYIDESDAFAHVAGYSCYNEGTIRDWQHHTHQFIPGKTFPRSGAFGPYLVTADEVADVTALTLTTRLNEAVMQAAKLDQLIFSIPRLIAYFSAFTQLTPGDVICTGTPGGVGFKRIPPIYMRPGDKVEVEISGLGTLVNGIEDEPSQSY
jgi:2-keto-4-pentenoate hydratase/2-oxohepta-3-ene-1,7-dioic acid hydratase in catechol pathway